MALLFKSLPAAHTEVVQGERGDYGSVTSDFFPASADCQYCLESVLQGSVRLMDITHRLITLDRRNEMKREE